MEPAKEGDGVIRHCAYCLNLCGFPAKLCGGCKKRAYCSKECQVEDWSSKGDGQHHVNWCRRHECGEEDVDWEVVPIPNKGLGIRAKKIIPAGLKIIVEPVFSSPLDHPEIMNLEPEGGILVQKFYSNIFMGGNMSGLKAVALRISRVNHACQPNASYIWDETARVAILYALKDIQPGEEVTSCYYYPLFRLSSALHAPGMNPDCSIKEELNFVKNMFRFPSLGIVCSADCPCFDPAILALIQEGRQLHASILTLAGQLKIEEVLAAGDKLLDVHRRLNVSWLYLGIQNFSLFHVAVMKSELLPRAMEYLRSAVEIFRKICPYSDTYTRMTEKLLEHPEAYVNYMMFDKAQGVSNLIHGHLLSGLNS